MATQENKVYTTGTPESDAFLKDFFCNVESESIHEEPQVEPLPQLSLNYWQLYLLNYLRSTQPDWEKRDERGFLESIISRAESASKEYHKNLMEGTPPYICKEYANKVLTGGLIFSKYDMLKEVFQDHFVDQQNKLDISISGQEKDGYFEGNLMPAICIELVDILRPTFEEFADDPETVWFNDNFTGSPEWGTLYDKLRKNIEKIRKETLFDYGDLTSRAEELKQICN